MLKVNLRSKEYGFFEDRGRQEVVQKKNNDRKVFSKLKGKYKLENMRLRGFRVYKRHVEWILITYLFEEFVKKLEKREFTLAYTWNQSC